MHATTVGASGSPRGDRTRYVVAAIAALVGLVWILQGIGVPIGQGSFMIGDILWAWIGAALVIVAFGYAAWPRLRRR